MFSALICTQIIILAQLRGRFLIPPTIACQFIMVLTQPMTIIVIRILRRFYASIRVNASSSLFQTHIMMGFAAVMDMVGTKFILRMNS